MNKLIPILIIASIFVLFGCTSSPVCGDLVCEEIEKNVDSVYYCENDCIIDNPTIVLPPSFDANFYTEKESYTIGEQITIQ